MAPCVGYYEGLLLQNTHLNAHKIKHDQHTDHMLDLQSSEVKHKDIAFKCDDKDLMTTDF